MPRRCGNNQGPERLLVPYQTELVGIGAPLVRERLGRDPAMGSSVILTGLTDALGFLVFLHWRRYLWSRNSSLQHKTMPQPKRPP